MLHIHRNKRSLIVVLALTAMLSSQAQQINPLYDRKPVHFGFGLIFNTAKMKFSTSPNYLASDTMRSITTESFPGFGLGGLVNFRLGDSWDLRTFLNVQFAQRNLIYKFGEDEETLVSEIESTYMEIPILVKYKSQRRKNTRIYVIGGATYRFDFTSDIDTDRSNTKPIVALYPNTFSYDIGVGLDFYFEFFKFSPELKISNGLGNAKVEDPFIFSQNIGRLSPKLIQFSLLFE